MTRHWAKINESHKLDDEAFGYLTRHSYSPFDIWNTMRLSFIYLCASLSRRRVKLNRVFFPRWISPARSLRCGFTTKYIGPVGISLIHFASLIRWRGIWLPYEGHSYSRELNSPLDNVFHTDQPTKKPTKDQTFNPKPAVMQISVQWNK